MAFAVALIGTLLHATDAPVWRADSATLSGPGTLTGGLFSRLARALTFLPLGSQTLRMALIGSISSAICAALLYHLVERLLCAGRPARRMDRWLALAASTCTVFSLPFVTDATIAGGGAVPAATFALGLFAWLLRPQGSEQRGQFGPRSLAEGCTIGVLLGVLVSESPWCGLALLLAAAIRWERPDRLLPWLALAVCAAGTSGGILGARAFSLEEGQLRALSLLPESAQWPPLAPSAYLDHVGFIWAGGALTALLTRGRDTRVLLTCLSVFALDLMIPANGSSSWLGSVEAEPARGALHLLALSALSLLGALGLRQMVDLLTEHRLLAAEKSAALLTLMALGTAIAGFEDADRLLSQTEAAGPSAWTTAALHPLPHNAIILSHTRPVSDRLRAAQQRGQRPDVLVVPLDSLAQAGELTRWLAREPALKQLIIDMSVDGTPSERALNLLCEQRPTYVEPDPSWDRRLLEHLYPNVPLARFSPHALGRSDRQQSIADGAAEVATIFAATEQGLHPDRATQEVLAGALTRLSSALALIDDSQSQEALSAAVPPELADLAHLPRAEGPDVPVLAPAVPREQAQLAK